MTVRLRALVTGGAVRVGRATCLALARSGCDVWLTYRSSEAAAKELARELRREGGRGEALPLGLEDLEAVERLGARLGELMGGVDVLVHNASVYGPTPLAGVEAEDCLRHFRVNALAPLLLSKHAAPLLAESERPGGGAIVAMCDIHASERPRKEFSAYAMSKAALEQMVLGLARELAPLVRVNGVAPGVVAFPEKGYESDAAMQERYLKRVPLGRTGTPEEAAEAVRWLALDATYTTGTILRVDGGRWLS
ncbi:MAG: SDR family oxidoreductase [Planctomycetota bacterium]|nr:SDR family oxidoreductase [Planctomycetota bacterium]